MSIKFDLRMTQLNIHPAILVLVVNEYITNMSHAITRNGGYL